MSHLEFLLAAQKFEPGDGFASLLREGVALSGLTQCQLAQELEVMPSTISRWIAEKTQPMPGMQRVTIARLARAVRRYLRGNK